MEEGSCDFSLLLNTRGPPFHLLRVVYLFFFLLILCLLSVELELGLGFGQMIIQVGRAETGHGLAWPVTGTLSRATVRPVKEEAWTPAASEQGSGLRDG